MWHPNKAQWLIIWITAVLSLFLWLGSASSRQQDDRLIVSVVVVGVLLVWQFARGTRKSK